MIQTLLNIWNLILKSNLFNFILMLLCLAWIIDYFDLGGALEKGRKSIEDKVNNAKQEHSDALNTLYETQDKEASVDEEAYKIIDKSSKNAVIVGENLLKEAHKQSETYSQTTQKAIDANIANAKLHITNETAEKAVNLAKKHIVNELNKDRNLQIKYINESLENLRNTNVRW